MSGEDDDDVTDMWREIMMTAMLVCDDEDGNDYRDVGRLMEAHCPGQSWTKPHWTNNGNAERKEGRKGEGKKLLTNPAAPEQIKKRKGWETWRKRGENKGAAGEDEEGQEESRVVAEEWRETKSAFD